jgi:Protein of unknown function (DUF2934)
MTAAEQEQHCRIRKRAYEIWLEEGLPPTGGPPNTERRLNGNWPAKRGDSTPKRSNRLGATLRRVLFAWQRSASYRYRSR